MRHVGLRADHLVERILGIVVGAQAPLLEHDVLFLVEILGLEVGHPIGFERDRHVDMVLVDRLEIIREVRFGERVILAAVLLDYLRELLGPDLLGALEHQVLAQMRQPGLAELLIARADAVEDVEGRDGSLVIFQHQHPQPVGQRLGFDRVGEARACGRRSSQTQESTERRHRGETAMIAKDRDAHRVRSL